ncbi:hypothetical protein DNTS_004355 [Danionella cerebrum]|uniref:Ig-like domain-containing protein n=1 Tax=Danionella cerebrum TaxID=2873325 RepID=A0A553P941_9TELE|nr:hypothetical protein DNTS_004355 [Danionella translucida]
MKFKVLLYLWLLGLIKPGSSADVSVSPGSSATLNCSFTLPSLVDDSLLNISWSFSGSVIASKNQTQAGFFLNSTAFLTGSFPLTIYNATPDQQGVYECRICYNHTDFSTEVALTIIVAPQISIISPEAVLNKKSVVECWARGFSPPEIMFTWKRGGRKIQEPQKLQVNRTEEGLYDAVSWLTFIPKISDQNMSFICEVRHSALVKPVVQQIRPHIRVLPKVSISAISSSSHSSPLTLSCDVSGFFPNNISVQWVQNGKILPELPVSTQDPDGTYRSHQFLTLSVEERIRGGEVQCVALQPNLEEPVYGAINLSMVDTREKLKSLNISAIVLPPRVVVGKKGRVTISVEGRLADRVQATWFLNDLPITDTSHKDKKQGTFRPVSYTPRNSGVLAMSEKSPLLPSAAPGYYKIHTQMPLRSSSNFHKQLFSSVTFIPNLATHKGAVFRCQISFKGKEKIVAERVSDKFTILAPPQASEIQFSEPSEEGGVVTMAVHASHFHPDIITFRWFCEGGELSPVSIPQALSAPRPNSDGFFSALSQCRLPETELERGEARVWVTIHHLALKQPITRQTRGFIKKPTISEIISSPFPFALGPLTFACDITGFYPPEISIKWLHHKTDEPGEEENGEREIQQGAEIWGPLQMQPRSYRMKAFLKDMNELTRGSDIICRVSHCSFLKPVERVWRNIDIVPPSIPSSMSVYWSRDGVGIFSVVLTEGKPSAEVLWAAGGTTVSKLISKKTHRENSEGKSILRSVCAVVPSTGRKETESHRGGYASKIMPPGGDHMTETEKKVECLMNGFVSEQENRHSDTNENMEENDEDELLDPSFINTVKLKKEKRERLRVTVEISHPALNLPAYLTWTEPAEEVSLDTSQP